jgi:hypothetical protein
MFSKGTLMQTAKTPNQKILSITWESVAKDVKAAVAGEQGAAKKWSLLADKLWILGVRPVDFREVKDDRGEIVRPANYLKIEGHVLTALGPRAKRLVPLSGQGLSGLTEHEREARFMWTKKRNTMMSRVAAYIKLLDSTEGKKGAGKKLHSEVFLEVVKYWIKRLKDNEEKIADFDSMACVELLEQIKKELT